jgi:hypothetical protein
LSKDADLVVVNANVFDKCSDCVDEILQFENLFYFCGAA